MNILIVGDRGICKEIREKLRQQGCDICVIEKFDDGIEVVNTLEWLNDNLKEETNVDGIVFGAYYKAKNSFPRTAPVVKMFLRNLFLPFILYKYLVRFDFLSDRCSVLFLLDKNRVTLGRRFLFYRLLQDNLILLMGMMNAYRVASHRVNCIEVGEHDDEVVIKNIVDILTNDAETTGKLIV